MYTPIAYWSENSHLYTQTTERPFNPLHFYSCGDLITVAPRHNRGSKYISWRLNPIGSSHFNLYTVSDNELTPTKEIFYNLACKGEVSFVNIFTYNHLHSQVAFGYVALVAPVEERLPYEILELPDSDEEDENNFTPGSLLLYSTVPHLFGEENVRITYKYTTESERDAAMQMAENKCKELNRNYLKAHPSPPEWNPKAYSQLYTPDLYKTLFL